MTKARRPEDSGEWESVRDSWVSPEPKPVGPPAADGAEKKPSTVPPPFASSPARQSEMMFERLAVGDYDGAVIAAEAILRRDPNDPDARQCAEIAWSELRRVYRKRLGDGSRTLIRAPVPDGTPQPVVEATMRLALSQVDGMATLDEIVSSGLLSPDETLRLLSEAYLRGLVVFV